MPKDLCLTPNIHPTDAEHGAQLRPAIRLQGGAVAVDDVVGLPRQLPGGAHDQAYRALICKPPRHEQPCWHVSCFVHSRTMIAAHSCAGLLRQPVQECECKA